MPNTFIFHEMEIKKTLGKEYLSSCLKMSHRVKKTHPFIPLQETYKECWFYNQRHIILNKNGSATQLQIGELQQRSQNFP